MNIVANTSQPGGSVWDRPVKAPDLADNKSKDDIALWWVLVDKVIAVARSSGWTKAEVARRINMADGTFSQWFSGKYAGRLDGHNRTVSQWLVALEESNAMAGSIPASPPFMALKISRDIFEILNWAQTCPDLVMVTTGAGMGKTEACSHYEKTRPHVYRATVSENTKTVHGMLVELAEELDVQEHNPARLARAIGNKLKRSGAGTLLIVDEGQHLNDEALNQLRHFVDIYKCGVAIVGNSEVYSRFSSKKKGGKSYAQLKSRVGKRLERVAPYPDDLATLIAAWNVTDPEAVKFLTGIGMKDGAFRQVDKTMKLAVMAATGAGEEVSKRYVEWAWKNRDVEDMA